MFAFPKAARLLESAEFSVAQRRGRRIKGRLLVGVVWTRPGASARFGLAVSRKVGNAVARNRVKRHLREAIRHLRPGLDGGDVVIIALPEAAGAASGDLRAEVAQICAGLAPRAC